MASIVDVIFHHRQALLWIPCQAELGFLNMENMCLQTPLLGWKVRDVGRVLVAGGGVAGSVDVMGTAIDPDGLWNLTPHCSCWK